MIEREATFRYAFKRIFFSRTFWIFAILLMLCAPLPTVLEYADRMHYSATGKYGRGSQYMLEYAFFFLGVIWLSISVLVCRWRTRIRAVSDPLFPSFKRELLHNLLLFSALGCVLSCFYILPFLLSAGLMTPLYSAARIEPVWRHASYPFFTILTVAFFNLLSYAALGVFLVSLFKHGWVGVLVNTLLCAISFYLAMPLHVRRLIPAGAFLTPAMEERLARINFLVRFNPGSLSVEIMKQHVFNWELALKMIRESLLFTASVLLLAFLVAHGKDICARRKKSHGN